MVDDVSACGNQRDWRERSRRIQQCIDQTRDFFITESTMVKGTNALEVLWLRCADYRIGYAHFFPRKHATRLPKPAAPFLW